MASIDAASNISDVDYRLIGLSPQYWSYTPLLIGDIINLPLINGADCFVTTRNGNRSSGDSSDCDSAQDVDEDDTNQCKMNVVEDHEMQNTNTNNDNGKSWHILPLSRVLLRGIATAIDRRPNGCTLIVLDDGTGSIDCRYWDDSHCGHSAFNLPPLLPEHEIINEQRQFRFVVGDSLEVMGKIKALTAGTSTTNNNDQCKISGHSATPLEVRFGCVREVHASSVCLIGKGETRRENQWNGEVVHWLKCMQFTKQCTAIRVDEANNTTSNCSRIRNGKDVLRLLGNTISTSILGGDGSSDFTNLDKSNVSNNILHRKCCQTSQRFRNAFFYCHCEATLEVLDPNLQFRDNLLNRLLDMEDQLQRMSDSCFPSATEDCMDLFGVTPESMPPPLLFTFESIYKDADISYIASEIVASTAAPEANAQRLVRKTFAALTNDGILSLYNHDEDLYLLVSRTRVIEPFLRRSGLGYGGFGVPQPFFIRSVPKKRISQIQFWIEDNKRIAKGTDNSYSCIYGYSASPCQAAI